MNGFVMLPCFTVETDQSGDFELTCNNVLGWIFEVFFAPFWDGKIKIPRSQFNNNHL